MDAIVLVGGEGTRLRPLTLTTPKPALPLVDRPFLFHMIEWLALHGVDRVILACGFKASKLRDALGGDRGDAVSTGHGDVRIEYVTEPDPRGTAGGIRFAADATPDLSERFFALNGDVLTDLDLKAVITQHGQTGARATLGLYPVDDVTGYGLVRRAEDGQITGFLEKPEPAEVDTDEINAGIYLLERDVLDLIEPGENVSIERDVFPQLVGNGLYGRRLEGYWLDIGTPERFLAASWDILDGSVSTAVETGEPVWAADDAEVDPAADVGPNAVIGPGSVIEAGACVWDSLIGAGCVVAGGAVVERTILGPGVRVDSGIRLIDAVVGEGKHVASGLDLAQGARIPGPDA